VAYQNLSASSPSSATAAAASSGGAIDSGIYLHATNGWQDDSSKDVTGVYETIDDVPTTSSSSRPTPLPRSTPAAATAASYHVDTDGVDLQAGKKLKHNRAEPRALNNLQPDDSGKRASNIYHTIDDAPTTSQSLYASPSPPAAAVSGSVIPEGDYSQPINSSDYMPMSPQHSSTSSSSQPTLLSPSTPHTAAVYEEAGAMLDEHNTYVQPSKSFDNATYLCQVDPSTEVSDA